MHLKINLHISRKIAAIVLAVLILAVVGAIFYIKQSNKNPLPPDIKQHVSFKVIYPSSSKAQIDKNSFVYQAKQKVLTFNVDFANVKVAYSEQVAPDSLGSDTQAYYPALGIHPYAQFKSDLGQVALTKFWQSGNLKPAGQSAVLASNGTFLIAHSEKNLTNSQWKDLFKSVKITK
jgi:uncharacterized protein YxeA